MNSVTDSIIAVFNAGFISVISYLPKLLAGILLLLVGLILSSIIKDVVVLVFKYLRLDKWFEAAGLVKEKEVNVWSSILAELVRWVTIFLFLMSSVDIWGVPKVGELISQLLLFVPNVFIAVIVGLVGLVVSNFIFDIVRHGVRGLGNRESLILANIAKYSIIFFTTLIILTQLGVAAELIKILFTGIVGMLTIAFGLAFGLGGQDEAREILRNLRQKINQKTSDRPRRK